MKCLGSLEKHFLISRIIQKLGINTKYKLRTANCELPTIFLNYQLSTISTGVALQDHVTVALSATPS